MIPKLSDVILSQMQRMLEVVTKPQIILHTDTGELEIKPGWLSPDAEANFNYLKEEYLKAIYMEAEFNNANPNTKAP